MQNISITFVHCWTIAKEVVLMLYTCYADDLCLLAAMHKSEYSYDDFRRVRSKIADSLIEIT